MGDTAASEMAVAFVRAFVESEDGRTAARVVGVPWWRTARTARQWLQREAVWQEIEDERARRRYAAEPYRGAGPPVLDVAYHCCVQRTGSQWLKAVLQDPLFYVRSGLAVYPYVALGHRDPTPPPDYATGTIATHLYIDRPTFDRLPKPPRYRAFFVQRDPRDALVSWYHAVKLSLTPMGRLAELHPILVRCGYQDGLAATIDWLDRRGYFDTLRSWARAGSSDRVHLCRYETMADAPAKYLADMFAFLDVRLAQETAAALAARYPFEKFTGGRPRGTSRPQEHYRRGTHGACRGDLPGDTLDLFYERTGDLVDVLGYAR